MRKILTIVAVAFSIHASAQLAFLTRDSINANNLNAYALVHGDMWWEPQTAHNGCFFPNGSKKNIQFAAALWMSGYDAAGQLHVAAQTYRQDGNDYWPGPLDGSGNLDYAASEKWAKIWKVTRAEINTYRATVFHTPSNTPESILTWPGKGNTQARGNGGVVLDIATEMAPFVDLDGDGNYEPLKGDYPDIKGEQGLWWVFSDNGPTHSQSDGNPLKVEVHAFAYAYKRGTLIDNVVYYDYTVVNKSPNDYHDFRLALWDDVALGYYLDNYLGFDSGHRMGIAYNATNVDGASAGVPSNAYGAKPPMAGVSLVSLPDDAAGSYVPAGSFTYYNNDPSIIGSPTVDTQYNNYMRAKFRFGHRLNYPALTPSGNYAFTGDPSDTNAFSECLSSNNPGSRRVILSSNSFQLKTRDVKKVVIALVVADSVGGCPGVNFNAIKEVADTAWYVYHNPPPPIFTPLVEKVGAISIYPNPVRDKLQIDWDEGPAEMMVSIYNPIGQCMGAQICNRAANSIDVAEYPPGAYLIIYRNQTLAGKSVFIKQ